LTNWKTSREITVFQDKHLTFCYNIFKSMDRIKCVKNDQSQYL
jgi:hypothetical protein